MIKTEKIYSKFREIKALIVEKYNQLPILDRYILKQLSDIFVLGVIIFTSIIFASARFKSAMS